MPVRSAAEADLAAVRELMHDATRRQVGLGDEDLAVLVAAGQVLLLADERASQAGSHLQHSQVQAMAAFYPEPRPDSLPAGAPDRVFLRAAAFRSGSSPSNGLRQLVETWERAPAARPRLLIAYGGEPWFDRALVAAGCRLAQEVIFLELPGLSDAGQLQAILDSLPPESRATTLHLALPAELDELAALDAACFDVLWHMGTADLRQLSLFGRLTVAVRGGALAGYLALSVQGDVAQVARLAVHPTWNGQGIARQLLVDGLRAAAELGCRRAILNTQATNTRAQTLYRSFGFRPTSERFAVYTRSA